MNSHLTSLCVKNSLPVTYINTGTQGRHKTCLCSDFKTELHVDKLPHSKPHVSKSDQTGSPLDWEFDPRLGF